MNRISPCLSLTAAGLAVVLFAASTAFAQEAAKPGPQVSLPLEEYERLRRGEEKPALTVIDTLRVAGSFKGRDLSLSMTGRASGRLPTVAVLKGGEVRIYGCEGDAILSRGANGEFSLTPLAARFSLRCRLVSAGSDRVELTATPAVLWAESQVEDGEIVTRAERDGGIAFTIVRVTASSGEALDPSATARYQLTLHPEGTGFRYQLDVRNPNRAHQPFAIELAGGERIQQVDARARYEADGARLRFDLPPGESTLVLTGTLPAASFRPPVEASVQYVLLEAHPLFRPVVAGDVKRISPAETGMQARFRGAQAFLLAGRQPLEWTATRLEALRTTSFALRGAAHRFFITAEGAALGESALELDNQGAPDLDLPMKAEPTYAALQGEAMLLTKNAKGALWMPLAQGKQSLLVQHSQQLDRSLGIARGTLHLPQLAVPATQASIELRYPRHWVPVFESFGAESRLAGPGVGALLWLLLLLFWTERVLAALGLTGARRLLLAAALAIAAAGSNAFAVALVVGDLVVTGIWGWRAVRSRSLQVWKLLLAALGAGLVLVLALAVALSSMQRSASSLSGSSDYTRKLEVSDSRQDASAPAAGAVYQGLPARFEMPWGARQTRFFAEMLRTDEARPVSVVLMSRSLQQTLRWLIVGVALAFAAFNARPLRAGWRKLVAVDKKRAPGVGEPI